MTRHFKTNKINIMKLENQVCTLEQAIRLKELGVAQDGLFTWVINTVCLNPETRVTRDMAIYAGDMSYEGSVYQEAQFGQELELHFGDTQGDELYSASTVAELGVMLPEMYVSGYAYKRDSCICCHYKEATIKGSNDRYKKWIGKGNTEAQARAAMLIYLLENNLTTAEEVNQRLQSA